MGHKRDVDFDGWIERSLRRELGRVVATTAPEREWVTVARPRRRGLTLASGAGGALGAKAATGLVVAAFATAATGTAVTGTANPVAWGEALQAAASNLPERVDAQPSAAPAPEETPANGPAAPIASAATPSPPAKSEIKHTSRPHAPWSKRHGHDPSD